MTTAYTSLLGLALPVTGELSGTWGDTVNNSITSLLDTAVAGTTTLSTDADVTLTTTTGASNQARQAILLCSGARTAARNITAPAQSKIYTVINATTGGYAVVIRGAGPTTGVTIPSGQSIQVAWNGSDFVDVSNSFAATGTANGVVYLNASKVPTTGSALTFDGTTLNFGGTAQRITGDMGSSPVSNRLCFQNSTANATTSVGVIPSGTGVSARLNVFNSSAPDNAAYLQLAVTAADTYLLSAATGTGTVLPFSINVGGQRYLITTSGESVWSIGSEQMRLTSTGLGIGTSSPAAKLDVSATGVGIQLKQSSTGSATYYVMDTTVETGGKRWRFGYSGASTFSNFSLYNQTDNITSWVADASGNLGLGVTPSAWATGSKAIQVFTLGAIAQDTDGALVATNNAYQHAAGAYKYLASSYPAALYRQASGQHQFFTAPSGTAGNAISFTQAMTLDASGNLGIGVTSPSGIIHAKGTANYTSIIVDNASTTGGGNFVARQNGSNKAYFGVSGSIEGNTSSDAGVFAETGGNIRFYTNGSATEKARIDTSGNLLVGVTSLASNGGISLRPAAANPYIYMGGSSTSNADSTYMIYSTGAGAYRFYVGYGGTISATSTTITGISDQRLKENIRDLDDGLAKVMALQPRKFDWKEGKGKGIANDRGFIAQEFEQVFPDMIEQWLDPAPEGEEPYKAVNANLIPTLVKAIQEQQAIINQLKARLDAANL